ncbi:MAG TPA: GDSL-type esterase/lipase family protein [Kofleriaceae bacterium]|nr:GDSL-type esterase/lipase family protein [Kofleriaceae bacterium]
MSAPERSWTIAPALGWFAAALVAGLLVVDGNVSALADRLTKKREAQSAGPAGTMAAAAQPDGGDDSDLVAKLPTPAAGSHDVAALDDVCIDGTDQACKHWAMDAFYRSFADAKAGKLGRALRVSWYGDSVVATDDLPGRLRSRLQSDLGDGGPGFVFALAPHRFCHNEGITRGGGENWLTYAISMAHTADGFYGPGGASVETNSGKTSMKLAGKITKAELYYLMQPHGGVATVTADGVEIIHANTKADAKAAAWALGTTDKGASKVEIKGEGKTRVFGISLENATGAVVDNLGIVSVHVKSFAAHNEEHYAAELAHRGADLIMIMIGANEAQWLHPKDHAMKEYQSHYEKLLAPIRKGRPEASCLVVSPTDQAEVKDDGYASRPVMPVLVAAQRAAAHAQGCAFYSTYDWMGGKGSSVKWFKRKYVNSDFLHLSKAGANKMADAVYDALMVGAKQYGPK